MGVGARHGEEEALCATLAAPAARTAEAEPIFPAAKRYSRRTEVFWGRCSQSVSLRPPRSAELTFAVTSVTVRSSAREVGRRKLNFGNPAERQGIRVFGSEAERGGDGRGGGGANREFRVAFGTCRPTDSAFLRAHDRSVLGGRAALTFRPCSCLTLWSPHCGAACRRGRRGRTPLHRRRLRLPRRCFVIDLLDRGALDGDAILLRISADHSPALAAARCIASPTVAWASTDFQAVNQQILRMNGSGPEGQACDSRAKTEHGKDAGSVNSTAIRATEDIAARRFAAVKAESEPMDRTRASNTQGEQA